MTHWSLPRGESGLCLASHETLFCSHERSLKSPEKLTEAFSDPTPTTEEINRTLEAMELIAPLSEKETARKSHQLFHVVMKAPRSLAYSQEKKWDGSPWMQYMSWCRILLCSKNNALVVNGVTGPIRQFAAQS